MPSCFKCDTPVAVELGIGRRDTCSQCGTDLRCCRNCDFFDPACHNQCREPQAERQVEKEHGNFCDFFRFRSAAPALAGAKDSAGTARAKLDALFTRRTS
jgi:hypothetical protein